MSPSGSGQKYYAEENQQLQKDLCIPDVRTFGKYMYVYPVRERTLLQDHKKVDYLSVFKMALLFNCVNCQILIL